MKPNHGASASHPDQKTPDILTLLPAIETIQPFLISNDSMKTFGVATVHVTTEVWAVFAISGIIKRLGRRQLEREGFPEAVNLDAHAFTTGYIFHTREGIRGFMVFEGFARNPCRVKLRYKLVESA